MLISELVKFVNFGVEIPIDTKYTATCHTKFLLKASSHYAYLENVKISGKTPDSDTVQAYIRATPIGKMHRSFLFGAERSAEKLEIKRGIVILDFTYEPFYGNLNSNPKWIHKYKPKKGCAGCFLYLCASVLIGSRRIFLDSVTVPVACPSTGKLVEEMLERLRAMGIKIEMLLLDRGFGRDSKVINVLEERNLPYLGLLPKQRNVKEILKEMKGTFLSMDFEIKGVKTRLIAIRDEQYDWVFVANIRSRKIWRYIQIYKKRWNIENGFQVCDRANIDSKSVEETIRYFFFLFTLVLYNIWKSFKLPVPFKRLVILLAEGEHKFASLLGQSGIP